MPKPRLVDLLVWDAVFVAFSSLNVKRLTLSSDVDISAGEAAGWLKTSIRAGSSTMVSLGLTVPRLHSASGMVTSIFTATCFEIMRVMDTNRTLPPAQWVNTLVQTLNDHAFPRLRDIEYFGSQWRQCACGLNVLTIDAYERHLRQDLSERLADLFYTR